ncbi:MAG TPA: Rrf2 family transcriptional regulator [Clostridiaceae bacterium]|jgi:Rrf2 family protein|nr:Rrf2 family transcriptional regulator [Clostridiaceae bacterium]
MISTRVRYALRMMVDLAQHQNEGFISLKDIANRQGISKKYLEQIIPILNRASFLRASRGFAGGYQLLKSPKDYTVGDVMRAIEGSLAPVACLEGETNNCPRCAECPTLFVWEGLQKVQTEYLDGITIQDILDKQEAESGNNYSI